MHRSSAPRGNQNYSPADFSQGRGDPVLQKLNRTENAPPKTHTENGRVCHSGRFELAFGCIGATKHSCSFTRHLASHKYCLRFARAEFQ
jgi:hypothetical protein